MGDREVTMPRFLEPARAAQEAARIQSFLSQELNSGPGFLVGLSGGIDSDVTCRLAVSAVGPSRVYGVLARQSDQEHNHVDSARSLAGELGIPLWEEDLQGLPEEILKRVAGTRGLSPDDPLLLGKTKNLLRTVMTGLLAEQGLLVLGTANRTEVETGFYLMFGDGIAHVQPIAHLYKSEVYVLARHLGSHIEVMEREPSAGYWTGETDLEDLAYWIALGRPVETSREALYVAAARVQEIRAQLDYHSLDLALWLLANGAQDDVASQEAGLDIGSVQGLRSLTRVVPLLKRVPNCRGINEGARG